jgi:hypothetical protein
MTRVLVDVAGWFGAASLLAAYALVSSGQLAGRGLGFQLLNLAGAIGLLVNGVYHGAWPSAGLNAVWLVVGLVGLVALGRLRPGPLPPRPGCVTVAARAHAAADHPIGTATAAAVFHGRSTTTDRRAGAVVRGPEMTGSVAEKSPA